MYAVGFSPGFAYLGGLPPDLHTPRLSGPRLKVPAGSVAIGGQQTGIYPTDSPGGWRLLGLTYLKLFDPDREEPALLRAGDRVRFVPVSAETYRLGAANAPRVVAAPAEGSPVLKVLHPGLQSTVQDLGRTGHQADGVPESGAADPVALRIGNRLVANPEGAAAIEMTLMGAAFEALAPVVVAVTGADMGPVVNGAPVPMWEALLLNPGDVLRFAGLRAGCRGYLCVAGGVEAPVVLGSRSTDLLGKLGRPPLTAGEALATGPATAPGWWLAGRRLPPDLVPAYPSELEVRVVPGPQHDRFAAEAFATLAANTYTLNPRSDRMGCRLDGPPLQHLSGADIISDGMPLGGIQIPPDGKPIILLQGRQTMGGYTKIGTVIASDAARVAQLPPGGRLRFRWVSRDGAHLLHRVAADHLRLMLDYCL